MNQFSKLMLPTALTLLGIGSSDGANTEQSAQVQALPNQFAKIPDTILPISSEPILVTKSLAVKMTYDSNATTLDTCTNKDLNAALATVLLFDNAGSQKEVGRFTVRDLWGGFSCVGHVNQSKTFPVALTEKGQHILVITAFSALDHWHGGDLVITPHVVIAADGITVVDHTYASSGGEQMVNEAHSVTYKERPK